jgi:hypothetical protein
MMIPAWSCCCPAQLLLLSTVSCPPFPRNLHLLLQQSQNNPTCSHVLFLAAG